VGGRDEEGPTPPMKARPRPLLATRKPVGHRGNLGRAAARLVSERPRALALVGPAGHSTAGRLGTLALPLEVQGKASERAVLLRTGRDLTIRGKVICPEETSPVGILVHAWPEDAPGGYLEATTVAEGGFVIGPLSPGRYRVSANTRFWLEAEGPVFRSGEQFAVVPYIPGASIEGWARAAPSIPSPGIEVVLHRSGRPSFPLYGWSSAREFSFEDLRPGNYDLVVRAPDGRIGTVPGIELAAGQVLNDLAVSLKPGGFLDVVYLGDNRALTLEVRQGMATVAAGPIVPGAPQSWLVPAGDLEVRVVTHLGDVRHARKVHAQARSATDVALGTR